MHKVSLYVMVTPDQLSRHEEAMIRGLTLICKVEGWKEWRGASGQIIHTTGSGSLGHFLSKDI